MSLGTGVRTGVPSSIPGNTVHDPFKTYQLVNGKEAVGHVSQDYSKSFNYERRHEATPYNTEPINYHLTTAAYPNGLGKPRNQFGVSPVIYSHDNTPHYAPSAVLTGAPTRSTILESQLRPPTRISRNGN